MAPRKCMQRRTQTDKVAERARKDHQHALHLRGTLRGGRGHRR
jgi:hypothetical protein